MSIPILNELQNELNRLYIAGSPLSKDDPRLKKYLPALQTLGQKAPVFAALAKRLEELLASEQKQSAKLLLEAGALLYAVQYTQGDTAIEADWQELSGEGIPLTTENVPYSQLSAALKLLASAGQSHDKQIEELVAANRHRDPRLYEGYVQSVSGPASYVSNYVEETVIPSIGVDMIPYLKERMVLESADKGDARLFRTLYHLMGKEILPLTEQVLQGNPSNPIYIEAIVTLAEDPTQEDTLLELARSRKGAVRQAAFATLIRMNSPKGEEALLTALQGDKIAPLAEALVLAQSPEVAQRIREQFLQDSPKFQEKGSKIEVLMSSMVERGREDEYELLFDAYCRYSKDAAAAKAMGLDDTLTKLHQENIELSNQLLYRLGDRFPEYAYYKIVAAVRMFDAAQMFDRCAPDLKRNGKLVNQLTAELGTNFYTCSNFTDDRRTWDRRWAMLLLRLDDAKNAYALIYDDDQKCWSKLLAVLRKDIKSNRPARMQFAQVVARACRNNHPKANKYYQEIIAAGYDKARLDEMIQTQSK